MTLRLRGTWVRLGLCGVVLLLFATGLLLRRRAEPSDAGPGRAVLAAALRAPASPGRNLALLRDQPQLQLLYLYLAEACRDADVAARCRTALARVHPPDSLAALYRDAAQALLLEDTTAAARWQAIGYAPALDPRLARLVVDTAVRTEAVWLNDVEAWWMDWLAIDSTAAAPAFGLGYAAVQRRDWPEAERLLAQAAGLAPNDPQPYEALGQVYFATGQPARFTQSLEAGITAARGARDRETVLRLRSTLGWGLAQLAGDYEAAERHLRDVLDRSHTLSAGATRGKTLYRLAAVLLKQQRYAEALARLDSAESLVRTSAPPQLPALLALRSEALVGLDRLDEAEAALEAATRQDTLLEPQVLTALAGLRRRRGRLAAARAAGTDALTLAQQRQAADDEIAARLVLSDVEQQAGRIEAARAHLEAGLERAQQTDNAARRRELHYHFGLVALDLGDPNTARQHFEQTLEGLDKASLGRAEAHLGLGRAYAQFHNPAEAIRHYDLALAMPAAKTHAPRRAEVLRSKAWALLDIPAPASAAALFEEARRSAPPDPVMQREVEAGLGTVALHEARYADALRHFRQAQAAGSIPLIEAWTVRYGQALALWRLGRLQEAERAFAQAVEAVEAGRARLREVASRAFFVEDKTQVYESFAAFLEEQGRSAEAFTYTERARSRSLADLVYTMQQASAAPMSVDARMEEDRRRQRLTYALAREDTAQVTLDSVLTDSAFALARAGRTDSLDDQAPSAIRLLDTFETLTADSTRYLLDHREALVLYDLRTEAAGAEPTPSVAYVVLPNEIRTVALDLDPHLLVESVRFFRDHLGSVEGGPGEDWEPAAKRLYRDLMQPVVEALPGWVDHLHIVPEGVLTYLPFAALVDKQGHFLVERYALSLAPSVSTLQLARRQNPRRWRSMLLFADPDGRLPGSRREVMAIRRQSPNRRQALLGTHATQANVEEFAPQYDVLHFATHGRFVRDAPWQSHLELNGGETLTVDEIEHLDLDAYLVTLSACETALSGGLVSDVPSGDEWIGLNQAFLAAGTPTVLSTLWAIDDRASGALMIDFYEALGPEGKAKALAAVQRAFIAEPARRHPFYWAAYTVIGDPL